MVLSIHFTWNLNCDCYLGVCLIPGRRTLLFDISFDIHLALRKSTSSVEMVEGEESSWGFDEGQDASSYLVLTLRLRLNLVRYLPSWIHSDLHILQKEEFQPYLFCWQHQNSGFALFVARVCTKVLSAPLTTSSHPLALSRLREEKMARPPWRSSFIRSRKKIRRMYSWMMETGLTKSARKRAKKCSSMRTQVKAKMQNLQRSSWMRLQGSVTAVQSVQHSSILLPALTNITGKTGMSASKLLSSEFSWIDMLLTKL